MLEWIKRLKELIKYWKARKVSDVQLRINMAKVNENNDYEDDDSHSLNELHSHWNNFQTYVNPTIWHWCILNGCRGITVRQNFICIIKWRKICNNSLINYLT